MSESDILLLVRKGGHQMYSLELLQTYSICLVQWNLLRPSPRNVVKGELARAFHLAGMTFQHVHDTSNPSETTYHANTLKIKYI